MANLQQSNGKVLRVFLIGTEVEALLLNHLKDNNDIINSVLIDTFIDLAKGFGYTVDVIQP